MKIALITDAWAPQVNGVVRTWQHVTQELQQRGDQVVVLHPGFFFTIPAPRYPEVRIAIRSGKRVAHWLDREAPDAIHIATEGPVGQAGRRWCLKHQFPFTTSYHTSFASYLRSYFGIPQRLTWSFLRRFHNAGEQCMVPTPSVVDELQQAGIKNAVVWSRGVDTDIFHPDYSVPEALKHLPRPLMVCAGRVAVEKNLPAFLSLSTEGTRIIIGDGPERKTLQRQFPNAVFTGYLFGKDLAAHLAACDVFVFPSLSDTYGIVMIEAMACGLPVAAFPVTGPIDVVQDGHTGSLDPDLGEAIRQALTCSPDVAARHGRSQTWAACAERLRQHLIPLPQVQMA